MGGALFALTRSIAPPVEAELEPIRISAARGQAIELTLARSLGRAPTSAEREAAIEAEIVDELLFQEALRRGLDQTDTVVRRRLAQNMRFLHSGEGEPAALVREARSLGLHRSDTVVRRRLIQRMQFALSGADQFALSGADRTGGAHALDAKTAVELRQPPRVRIAQIFFDPARGDAAARARTELGQLRELRAGPDDAGRRGDPLLAPAQAPWLSERELANRFGPEFAQAVWALSGGEWQGPVASSYGEHLVFVRERRGAEPLAPGVATVALAETARSELAEARLRRGVRELRGRYEIVIERPD